MRNQCRQVGIHESVETSAIAVQRRLSEPRLSCGKQGHGIQKHENHCQSFLHANTPGDRF